VEMVQDALEAVFPELETEVVIIETSGDWRPSDGEVALAERDGGKAQFAKEIEEALLAREIDCAVHSMKDMDSFLPDGLMIDHMLPREDARDALLFSDDVRVGKGAGQCDAFEIIPHNASVGTVSVRRAAFLLAKRPDLKVEPFRGNVQTRIGKLRVGQVDVTMLAIAGLKRLGIEEEADVVLDVDVMLPAAAQGAIGIEVRNDDHDVLAVFSRISDVNTVLCVKAERSVLKVLDGSCQSPIGCYAVFEEGQMWIRVRVASLDGSQVFEDDIRGSVEDISGAQDLGNTLGARMKAMIPDGFLGA